MNSRPGALLKVGFTVGLLALAFYLLRRFAVVIVPGLMLLELLRQLDGATKAEAPG